MRGKKKKIQLCLHAVGYSFSILNPNVSIAVFLKFQKRQTLGLLEL